MRRLFRHCPEALKSTLKIAERLRLQPRHRPRIPPAGRGCAGWATRRRATLKGCATKRQCGAMAQLRRRLSSACKRSSG